MTDVHIRTAEDRVVPTHWWDEQAPPDPFLEPVYRETLHHFAALA